MLYSVVFYKVLNFKKYSIILLLTSIFCMMRGECEVGYSSEVDTRYWYGNLPVEYFIHKLFKF